MLNEWFVVAATAFNLVGTSTYLFLTLQGRVQPNRVTWFMWALAPLIAFTAEVGESVGLPALMTLVIGIDCTAVFIASFAGRSGYWRASLFDLACGFLSLLGLFLWAITRHGEFAIGSSIVSDAVASLPTLAKAYRSPKSENPAVYWCATFSAIITMATLKDWNFSHWGFPLYIAVDSLAIALTLVRRGRASRDESATQEEPVMAPPKHPAI